MSIKSKAKRDKKKNAVRMLPTGRSGGKLTQAQQAAILDAKIRLDDLLSGLSTPEVVSADVLSFCEGISSSDPVFLTCEPEPWSRQSCCDLNVNEFIRIHGGTSVFGYRIWTAGDRYVEAERHAVWTNGESLRDVSFVDTGEAATLFLPDDKELRQGFDDRPLKIRRGFSSADEKLVGLLTAIEPPIERMSDAEAWSTMLTHERWLAGERMSNIQVQQRTKPTYTRK